MMIHAIKAAEFVNDVDVTMTSQQNQSRPITKLLVCPPFSALPSILIHPFTHQQEHNIMIHTEQPVRPSLSERHTYTSKKADLSFVDTF